uniref:NADH-ubiquinone oxidoreductase chain 3 n=1 Tax=Polygraphus poligraphus TaxID=516982 RepID=A0A8F5A1P7_9CUCU|nr:NADH dehydrogenase subunit 3 [Polygraphus poligraphus]QXG82899.1 NADH dehydrogenase subunit 3 [Polygraphus poligraphus]UJX85654.1 NADH dehydrogenase subunit 3 [Polygraphus poligraphus]
MFMITLASMIFMLIILILTSILNIITKKTFLDREKTSPFECGFDPKNLARLPFSLHFFLIAIIFIIFDVELTLFLPMIIIMKSTNTMALSVVISLYILILLFGLFHEQSQGSLNWTI